ncbi:MAG: type II secretion system minor pseudopilin GspJ [Chromatiales bacterium]|nr:type II secretion system minor pseudopilin GspJ [Chromatiales bacterium]
MSCRRTKPSRFAAGFTLLELLLALAIFSLVSAMAYGGLKAVLDAAEVTNRQAGRLDELQRAFLRLETDLEQAAPRPIRDAYGDRQPAMRYEAGLSGTLEFTRGGRPNPAGFARSDLERIAYRVKDKTLYRYSWLSLDRGDDTPPLELDLVSGVETLQVRFLGPSGEWDEDWPPRTDETDPRTLPKALGITLQVEGFGEVYRVFRIAG